MKVVFLEDVPGTAHIGDIKDVKPGFARNFLLPRKLAMPATPSIIKSAEARAAREARLQDARDNEARNVAEKLEAATITITAKAGGSGKLFGSVGAADIAEKVAGVTGGEFDRHNVLLAEPIKELGDYRAGVRLTRNINATLNISVVGEDGTTAADIKARAEAGKSAASAKTGETEEAPEDEGAKAGEEDVDA